MARRRLALTVLIVAGIDCISKSIALVALGANPHRIIGSLLSLHLVRNTGAAFSVATNRTILLSIFSLLVAALITRRASTFSHRGWLLAAGLVVGGICGNLIDRILRAPGAFRGAVVDWIEVTHWPTFNLADSSIVIGAVLAAVLVLRNIPPVQPPKDDQMDNENE